MGIINTISSILIFSPGQVTASIAFGYIFLIVYLSNFEDFWEKLGGTDKAFLSIAVGFFVLLPASFYIKIVRKLEGVVFNSAVSIESGGLILGLSAILLILSVLIRLAKSTEAIKDDKNPLGVFLTILSIFGAFVILKYLIYAPYAIANYGVSNIHMGIILSLELSTLILFTAVLLLIGRVIDSTLLPEPNWRSKIERELEYLKDIIFQSKFFPRTNKSKILVISSILVSLVVLFALTIPSESEKMSSDKVYRLTGEINSEGNLIVDRGVVQSVKYVNISRLGPLDWYFVEYGSMNISPELYLRGEGYPGEIQSIGISQKRDLSGWVLNYTKEGRELLKNNTIVIKGSRYANLSGKISINEYDQTYRNGSCTTNFTVSTEGATRFRIENLGIYRENAGSYNITKVTTRSFRGEGTSVRVNKCNDGLCMARFDLGYLTFIRGTSNGAIDDELIITGGEIFHPEDLSVKFTVKSQCET